MRRDLAIATAFGMAFAYIESAVVVYLRAIFHPNGFVFPLAAFDVTPLAKRLLLTEIGREAATLVLIGSAAWLFGRRRQERAAYFLLIFAVWDIFYYIWLKVLLGWPASLMTWDVLFLIPVLWASPVLYPVLVSLALWVLAVAILHRQAQGRPLVVKPSDAVGWTIAAAIVVVSFCLGGTHASEPDYRQYFHWPLFAAGYALGLACCLRAWCRKPAPPSYGQAAGSAG